MELIFVRHPETTYNAAGNRYCGRTDAPLNDLGLQQVEALQNYFADRHVTAMWCSPLTRARTCAEAVAETCDAPLHVSEHFTEFDFGAWEGMRPKEIRAQTPDLWAHWNAGMPHASPPEGEQAIEVYKRAVRGLYEMVDEVSKIQDDKRKTVVIVSHDQVIRLLFTHFLGLPYWYFRRLGAPKNASLSRVRGNGTNKGWRIQAYSHTIM